jgi:putative lumazine-binding protein
MNARKADGMSHDVEGLLAAVRRYFDLMYESDLRHFDRVFAPTAQLHGFREGRLTMWSAGQFKDVMASRPSPHALKAPREEAILSVDFAAPDQAVAKVRVRIGATVFVDCLAYHRADGEWLITHKAYNVDRVIGQ